MDDPPVSSIVHRPSSNQFTCDAGSLYRSGPNRCIALMSLTRAAGRAGQVAYAYIGHMGDGAEGCVRYTPDNPERPGHQNVVGDMRHVASIQSVRAAREYD